MNSATIFRVVEVIRLPAPNSDDFGDNLPNRDWRLVGNATEAEELTAETFARAYQGWLLFRHRPLAHRPTVVCAGGGAGERRCPLRPDGIPSGAVP